VNFQDVLLTAFEQLRTNKLRSIFTVLGIIVSVTFLVAVVAIIQGMNAYVRENLASALIGANTFQVRRTPIQVGLFDDELMRRLQRRPKVQEADAHAVAEAVPDAIAVSRQSGWPTPTADLVWKDRTMSDISIFGVTAPYQIVQDYQFAHGRPLSDVDVNERRAVVVIGADIGDKLFDGSNPVGNTIRIKGDLFTIVGVVGKKGRVLGQSFDTFVLMPISRFEALYGRRKTTTISVKMPTAASVSDGMRRAEEAMRLAHHLRPQQENDFSVETADALVSFWKQLTAVLFAVIPAVVAIGIVVGGIVIMNIMLMSVSERTREIGVRKSLGATASDISKQFLAESVMLASLGGVVGVLGGWGLATAVSVASPLPARITAWSVVLSILLGGGVGILFGVYPASRAAKLDPITALRSE
jgi:putative ABC transport system permease protein